MLTFFGVVGMGICTVVLAIACGLGVEDMKGKSIKWSARTYVPIGVAALVVGATLTYFTQFYDKDSTPRGGVVASGSTVTTPPTTPPNPSTTPPTSPPTTADDTPSVDLPTTPTVPSTFSVPLTSIYGGTGPGHTVTVDSKSFDFASSASNGRTLGDPGLVTTCSQIAVAAVIRDDAAEYANGGENLEVLSGNGVAGDLPVPIKTVARQTFALTGGRLTFAVSGAVGIYWNGTLTCSTPDGLPRTS